MIKWLVSFTPLLFTHLSAAPLSNALDAIMQSHKKHCNGIVIIAKDRTITYQNTQGIFGSPTFSMQFCIGSLSKQFTAVILLTLVDKGLVDLNQPLSYYLPKLEETWATQVTVKQLLNHTSGIVALGKPLAFAPGTQFLYSPAVAHHLASQIAEITSGKSYSQLLQELCHKAHLTNTAYLKYADMQSNYRQYPQLAKAWQEQGGAILPVRFLGDTSNPYTSAEAPGGGIISTAQDLRQWNIALHGGALLSKESYQAMITPLIQRPHPRYGQVGYGFGLQILEQDGYTEFSHSGYKDGYIATMLYYPTTKTSVIILENVSWDITNPKQAFLVHDLIRDAVRVYEN